MEALFAIAIGTLTSCAVYLLLRARTFPVLLGLTLLSYAVNLFLFVSGRLVVASAPLTDQGIEHFPDPLPQALVLTAIVIGFATTALFLVVLLALRGLSGGDHVDGEEERP